MAITTDPDALRAGLRQCVDALHRRRADEISEALVDQLVGCDWLEWHGGTLRLTTTGANIHRRELAQMNAAPGAAGQVRSTLAQGRGH